MTAQANNGIPYVCSSMLYDGWEDAFAMHHHLIGDTVDNIYERYRSWMGDCKNRYGVTDQTMCQATLQRSKLTNSKKRNFSSSESRER